MTAEELYQKEFGNADSVPKESVIRLLKHFAKVIKIEREQALRIHDVVGRSEQLKAFRRWMIENECTKFGSDEFVVNDYLKSL
ncbi:MAG TPA: hypothetical protein DCL81_15075 [Algoriphagus sp.]|jgi:hypothetical protein|uniref:hypothetical protein n=1 Tax=Algoriphagus sp. TaxID=1872435 RepID=UPI000C6900EA|nr:hypothetical protein [Algoriphagus sp.]MAL13353.1 hypothetical protein [Algoriphagus sp.]MAN85579.1 hypothetical protein [Algoriphagus sp.]HAD52119.1 hypothetical protein [Algoriphagus sp.]HAH37775.1 hypothetical protein [Algoriphagus sp.]HAS58487.1 hypothetical protein [Algoriphagus sp.]|tara:strand:- start:2862 stop:3110 length:249 start_codon:yes stop_codon:yes gene_type:complete